MTATTGNAHQAILEQFSVTKRAISPWRGPDYLKSQGCAIALAEGIQDYWRAKGHPGVMTWTEPMLTHKGVELYAIRSNLLNGKPRY